MKKNRNLSPLLKGIPGKQQQKIKSISAYVQDPLCNIKRRSGEDYHQHGCEVAEVLRELTDDAELVAVAIAHDLLLHKNGKQLLKQSGLSRSQQKLVNGMNAMRRLHIDEKTKDLKLTMDQFTQDGRLLLLRMAHRLNDVRNLKRFKGPLKVKIAQETLHMYAAIAGRLGLNKWMHEMEDRSFEVLHPRIFKRIHRRSEQTRETDELCLKLTKKFLSSKLKKEGVRFSIETRIKGAYSTYRKMSLKNRQFHEITDRLALRIIVEKPKDCYRVLGVAHGYMNPIPGELKDYIGAPKQNGYRSIHTVVYPLPGVTEKPIEIQIRTQQMHQECEYGIASHSDYKVINYSNKRFRADLFRNLERLHAEIKTPKKFEQALITYFDSQSIIVFDHRNNIFHLKKPATFLDFVCLYAGKKILKLVEGKVNGHKSQLGNQLNDGDVVEVKFGKENTLKKSWVRFCNHQSSKEMIKKLF